MDTVVIKVVQDSDVESPRSWDNLGVMACWHRRYRLGDVQPKEDPDLWLKTNAPKGSIVLPLYLYDHSGLCMRVSRFADLWDSGQVGWIVATPKAIRKIYGVKRISKATREQAETALRGEVETYDDFLTGNVWGYTLESAHSEDSCGGFFGDALEAMKSHVDAKYHDALTEAWHNRG